MDPTSATLINSHGFNDNHYSEYSYASFVPTCCPYEVKEVGSDEAIRRGDGSLSWEPSHADDPVNSRAPPTNNHLGNEIANVGIGKEPITKDSIEPAVKAAGPIGETKRDILCLNGIF